MQVKEAARLLQWLRERGTSLSRASQRDIDLWLSDGKSVHQHARPFVKWAADHRHARGLNIPPPVRAEPSAPLDNDKRIDIAKRLLSDTTLALDLRVAGLLTVLFAQPVATVTKIRIDQVTRNQTGLHLLLGREPLHLPGRLGELVEQLAESRRPHSNVGDGGSSPWLFPGRHPEQHLSASTARNRMQKAGIPGRATQHSALRDLSQALPEAAISRLLGISVVSVDRWKTGGQWASYAAVVAQRL